MHATDVLEADWLAVPVKWFELKQVRHGYVLSQEEHLVPVSVNTIVRLLGLEFSNSYSAGREIWSVEAEGSPLHFLDEDSHHLIQAACRHDMGEEEEAYLIS